MTPGMRTHITLVTLAFALAALSSCAPREQLETEWIGKTRNDLTAAYGQPRGAVAEGDTGGEELFYSYQGHHYVFETGPDGKITRAVEVK